MAAALIWLGTGGAAPADDGADVGAVRAAGRGVTVRVAVTALRNHDGVVMACMTTNEGLFPRCRGDTASYRANVPAGSAPETVTITFTDVRPGTYAIALLHDENGNGKADRAISMIPREGYGFSNDAPVRMGPPKFDAAAFTVGAQPVRQTIRMRYML
ncbi:DUF2141 domain-containing protein [Croceibacterium sp. TMG7-5b_MA50]|uniref:DUF2141 domain-containing protein n=1 Tax=Croceibacterium sp. TMG7-5b_MA50 TaxID=3121290 RepID=UPI003221E608